MAAFITRKIPAHQALAGLATAVRLSGRPIDLIPLREVNMPRWAKGLANLVRAFGLVLVHVGLVADIARLGRGRSAIVREFLVFPTLLMWPALWFWRRRLWFLVHHNFDTARRHPFERLALRLLAGSGMRLLCFENDAALDALGLARLHSKTAVIRHPLNSPPPLRPAGEPPVVGVVGSIRAEKGARELLEQLTAAARLGVLPARLLLGTSDAATRAEFAAQGWETADTSTDADYAAALARCDVLVLNYVREKYFFRPSGVIADALGAGVVPVAPDFPVMREQLNHPARAGVLFDSPVALLPAIRAALELARNGVRDAMERQWQERRPEELARRIAQLCPPAADPFSNQPAPRMDLSKSVTRWPLHLKIRRGVWQFLVKPWFMLSPRWASKLRIALLRCFGAKIGAGCYIERRVDVLMPWNLEMGEHVALGRDVEVYNYAPVKIGSMSLVSQYSYLCTGTHDHTHPHMPLTWAPITIGQDCWVAAGAFIAPGVTIGDGAVIGARAVVTRDMPPWMICAGNPCRPLKPRVLRDAAEPPRPPRS